MKKFLRLSSLFALALAITSNSWAQERSISGKVTSIDDGSPLPGVNVVIKGTTNGTITDFEGKYTLRVGESSILIYSFIGYTNEEVAVGARAIIDVQLSTDIQQLSEVVVTAFGIEREKKALSFAVQDIGGDRIAEAGTPNAVNALQGKIAGVQINQSSGMPGSSSFIRIRGSNSFSANNQPLFVIDGVPVASSPSSSGGVRSTDKSSRSLDINQNDIESISVLKGASAGALYGLRASNGVVLITTKSGKNLDEGTTDVTFSQSYAMDKVSATPTLQSKWAQGSNGTYGAAASTSWGPLISDLADPAFNASATGDGLTYVNNVGETVTPKLYDNISPLFQTGHTSTTNIGISGRTSAGHFGVSLGYTKQDGVIPTTGMERITVKLSGEHSINDKLTVGGTVNVANTKIDKLAGGSNLSNVLFTTYWAPGSYDLWGTPFATEDDPYKQIHYRGAMDNPRWSLIHNDFRENVTRTFGSVYSTYKPTDWLSVNYRLGYDAFGERNKEVFSLGSGNTGGRTATPSGGQIDDFSRFFLQVNSNLSVVFSKELNEDLLLDVTLGNEINDQRIHAQQQIGTGVTIGGFNNISNTTAQTTSLVDTNSRQVGFYGAANVAWRDMLFLNATGRQDYTSVMPKGNRSFFYPSVGVGFVFTEALDLATNNIFNFGKIRASYAEVGQAAVAAHSTQLVYIQAGPGTGFTTDGIAFPFNGQAGFQQSNILRNPDLSPQNSTTFEGGLEANLFQSRLGLDVNYFKENTVDQIFSVPISSASGFSSELRNAGEIENKGWEVSLNGTPIKTSSGFTWDVSVNYTRVESNVVSLAPGVDNIFLGGFTNPNVRASAGGQYPIIYGSQYLRDDAGNVVHDSRQTINGNANLSYGMPVVDPNFGVLGKVNPDFEMGISTSFNYKGIRLGIHVDMREGASAYAGNTRLQKLYGQDIVTEDRTTPVVLNGVKGYLGSDGALVNEGVNDISIVRGQRYWNVVADNIDETNVFSTDFLRLREVNISYEIPSSILSKLSIKSASVYVMGRNLLLLTDYPNFDPETSVGGAGNFQGLEYVNLPQTRSFGAGLNIKF